MIEAITEALRVRFPGRTDDAYRLAALRVHFNLESEGPVTDVDRLFLGGRDGDATDAEILIERTLVSLREKS